MKKGIIVFKIDSNPVGLGAKVLSYVPAPEQPVQSPANIKGQPQCEKSNLPQRGSKRNI